MIARIDSPVGSPRSVVPGTTSHTIKKSDAVRMVTIVIGPENAALPADKGESVAQDHRGQDRGEWLGRVEQAPEARCGHEVDQDQRRERRGVVR